MNEQDAIERLAASRIVPVVVLDDAAMAVDLAAALAGGGIHCAEITLRTEAGPQAIRAISCMPDFLVGVGTVLSPEQVDRSVDSGAQFIVSPGLDEDVVSRAQRHGVAVLPGVATATEVQRALRAGLHAVKFFPAQHLGGIAAITSLAAPFPHVRFMPSGGVTAENVRSYLTHPAVFAVGASWMVPREVVHSGDFEQVQHLASLAVALMDRNPE